MWTKLRFMCAAQVNETTNFYIELAYNKCSLFPLRRWKKLAAVVEPRGFHCIASENATAWFNFTIVLLLLFWLGNTLWQNNKQSGDGLLSEASSV